MSWTNEKMKFFCLRYFWISRLNCIVYATHQTCFETLIGDFSAPSVLQWFFVFRKIVLWFWTEITPLERNRNCWHHCQQKKKKENSNRLYWHHVHNSVKDKSNLLSPRLCSCCRIERSQTGEGGIDIFVLSSWRARANWRPPELPLRPILLIYQDCVRPLCEP